MTGNTVGVVLERTGGTFRVLTAAGEVEAVLRKKVKRRSERDRVVVGDRVTLDEDSAAGTRGIAEVAERRSILTRRTPDRRGERPIAANLDQVMVFTAVARPDPVAQLTDRLLVIAEANDLPACVVITKTDLGDPGAELERIRAAGYDVFPVCAKSGAGVAEVAARMAGRTSLLTGPSGVGKSSLLNRIQPDLGLRTAEVSKRIRRGRQTTVAAVMIPLDPESGAEGGYVVDTPGFSDAGLWAIVPRELAHCFPEMRACIGNCRFDDCRHLTEPACAVRDAVEQGSVAAGRYESYRIFLDELLTAPKPWE